MKNNYITETIMNGRYGSCEITQNDTVHKCNKCITPNKRNGKWYCPKYKVYLEQQKLMYTSIYRNISEEN